jgi:uncharacterized protein YceK
MRSRFLTVLLVGVLATLQCGCGTVLNLYQAPRATTYRGFGPQGCEPFGGVEHSYAVGGWLLTKPVSMPLGATIWAVDVPLSLVGDTVTYPLALARKRKAPWATWWGEQITPEEAERVLEKEANTTSEPALPRSEPVPGTETLRDVPITSVPVGGARSDGTR